MSIFKSFLNKFLFRLVNLPSKIARMDKVVIQVQPEENIKGTSDSVSDAHPCEGPRVTVQDESSAEVNGMKRELEVKEKVDEVANKKLKTEQVIRRRKVAVLLSYCGHGYMGMQRNPGIKTIEDDLLTAMLKAGMITQEHVDLPQTINFQRAARTDKGVSAARQVVSLRIGLGDNLRDQINIHLPPSIRVQSIIRTTKGFNSKFWCDARTYSYTLPTFAFAPSTTTITNEDYRIDETIIEKVNNILKSFKGTRNFYNYTSGKKFEDASAKRYIMEFECGKPFVEDGLEIVVITVKGQSFMLHQIRKMIGITIAIMRDLASKEVLEKAFNSHKVDIPIAPGLGLVLEEVHYDKYNNRYAADGIHESLSWDNIKDEIEAFKRQYIYLPIIRVEKESKSMLNWLATLPNHTYDVREPGAPDLGNKSEFGKAKKLVESVTDTETVGTNDKT